MLTYRPDNFVEPAMAPDAVQAWQWLQEPEQIATMRIACRLHRPAVEALSDDLKERFPRLARFHLTRQMIGHMVRQVMESKGYYLNRSNVRIRYDDNVFRRGATYRYIAPVTP